MTIHKFRTRADAARERPCYHCGAPFRARRSDALYCPPPAACRYKAWRARRHAPTLTVADLPAALKRAVVREHKRLEKRRERARRRLNLRPAAEERPARC